MSQLIKYRYPEELRQVAFCPPGIDTLGGGCLANQGQTHHVELTVERNVFN